MFGVHQKVGEQGRRKETTSLPLEKEGKNYLANKYRIWKREQLGDSEDLISLNEWGYFDWIA